ncbi:DUF2507 domain-containing protein [Alkalibacterium sp.]|nr:MAG: DUF2507 domain-containing protein [Alkalibacterium sp.]
MSHDQTDYSSQSAVLLLRDRLLPNLFRDDEADILYWAGKELARDYELSTMEELSALMAKLSFGKLTLEEEKKTSYIFHLQGEVVHERLKANSKANFSLESGFIAQAVQKLSNHYTEGSYTVNHKARLIRIQLETDPKEPLD